MTTHSMNKAISRKNQLDVTAAVAAVPQEGITGTGTMQAPKFVERVLDCTAIKLHNGYKLVSPEDPYHFHKSLGILATAHYVYRITVFVRTGSFQFDDSLTTLYAIILHTSLSCSSLIFHIPNNRVRSAPMIYPEFRLHSIIFGGRSLVIMALLYFARRYELQWLLYLRGAVVLLTMWLADLVTKAYKDQGTTMRGMPFPDYMPSAYRDHINMYYSVSQLCATCQMLFSYRLDEAFLVLFPIQIAAFLMTCVRKSIITAGAWHFYYAASLGLNYVLCPFLRPPLLPPTAVLKLPLMTIVSPVACLLRFQIPNINKYHLWFAIVIIHLCAMQFLNLYNVVIV